MILELSELFQICTR